MVTALERIRQPPARPLIAFTGIAGVYLGLLAEVEHVAWLYVPCLTLLRVPRQFSSVLPAGRAIRTTTAQAAP